MAAGCAEHVECVGEGLLQADLLRCAPLPRSMRRRRFKWGSEVIDTVAKGIHETRSRPLNASACGRCC
ncbi:hypothetical protein ACP70R_046432 [Stipagrostis hirtigluma subsp. patula]